MKKWITALSAALLMGITYQAAAYDAIADVKITQIELTYMPQHIVFWADRAVGSCPAGAMLDWVPQNSTQSWKDQNAQAVLAALMTAKATGAAMRLFIINSGCRVEYIYLL